MKFKNYIEVQSGIKDSANSSGTPDQVLTSTATGVAWVDPSTITAEAATLVVIECKNTSGATITKGTPVYQTGTVGATDVIEIAVADASDEDKMAAIGLLQTTLNNNGFGKVVITGELLNITTSPIDGVTPITGDTIYVKPGGGLTLTKPTGVNFIQNVGLVGKVSGGNAGSITVSSIMRTNDIPNLTTGKIWVGTATNTAESATVYLDEPNGRMGINTTTPTKDLEIGTNAAAETEFRMHSDESGKYFNIQSAGNFTSVKTTGSQNFILDSSGSSGYITMVTNASERMRVNYNGNVGIGTTSPSSKFQVSVNDGDGITLKHDTSNAFYILRDGSDDTIIKQTRNYTSKISISTLADSGTHESSGLNIVGQGVGLKSNVGIGTAVPLAKLHVKDGNTLSSALTNTSALIEGFSQSILQIASHSSGYSQIAFGDQDDGFDGGFIYSNVSRYLSIETANVERMRIDSSGNIGIGTTTPATTGGTAKLTVNVGSGTSSPVSIVNGTTDGVFIRRYGTNGKYQIQTTVGAGNSGSLSLQSYGGNVGIGTTSPLQPLSIESSTSPLIKIRNTTNGGGAGIEFNDNASSAASQNGRITYYHSDSASQGGGSSYWLTGEDDQTLVLANNGRVVVQKSGSTTEVGYGFYDDTNTGMYRVSADALGFSTGGTRRLDMNSSGVRIGTGSRVSTILDQDNMSSNSSTALATQQSIKAYVDNSVAAIITPAAPTTVTSTIVGETIEIAFNESATSDIDYYQVWSSDDGGDYGIIGQITSDDFSLTMTVVDTTFVTGGTMSYRIYAVRQGVYSAAATTSESYTVSALSVTNMTVVNLNTAYYIQYEKPNSRFIDHIEIYMDSQTTLAALNRSNATLVYSGQNASYMRSVGTSSNFHQFWVEVVTS